MKPMIHVVEDEKQLNDLVRSYLEAEGYDVRPFYTYEEAMAAIEADDVSLWILDIMLKEKSGFDLIDQIKMRNPMMPVIFMSARVHELDRVVGLEKGSDDYIAKPFLPKELVTRVNNLMRRVYKLGQTKLMVDVYVIDEVQRKVYTEDEEIELTTKEFELLMMFARKQGVAFDREYILKEVWGTDYFGSDRVVDDTMRRLRKKMPDLNIHTIYGYGYRLG